MRWTTSKEEKEAIANLIAGKDIIYLETLLQGLRKEFWTQLVIAIIIVAITRTVGFLAFFAGILLWISYKWCLTARDLRRAKMNEDGLP